MSTATAADTRIPQPQALRWPLSFIADLGGAALLFQSATIAPFRGRQGAARLLPATIAHVGWMLAMGIPLVGLVHVSIGSFLAMQAYFGATFTEGAGIVVGLGLIRNIAPLLTGFILIGLLSVKITADLRGGPRPGLDDVHSVPDRDVERGIRLDDRPVPSIGRIAFVRILAASIAGFTLTFWAVAVGVLMGLFVSKAMLGQSPEMFLGKIAEMLTLPDVIGLVVKGVLFAGSTALITTFEGLRSDSRGGPDAYRAVIRSLVLVLFLNFTWFNLVYLAGDPFGPNVATMSE